MQHSQVAAVPHPRRGSALDLLVTQPGKPRAGNAALGGGGSITAVAWRTQRI